MFGGPEIERIVAETWSAVLGWEVALAEGADGPDDCLTGSVGITGAWTGNVMLHCHRSMAHAATASIFGLPAEEVGPELVRDVLGELTNIVGGNLKALFGGKCRLGLPTVADGAACAARVPGGRTLFRVPFASRGLGLVVEVAERTVAA